MEAKMIKKRRRKSTPIMTVEN